MPPSYLLFINHVTLRYINPSPWDAELFVTKKTKDGQRSQPGGRRPQHHLSRGHHTTPPPQSPLNKKNVVLHIGREQCGNWAQSNGLKLCRKHQRQLEKEQQRLVAASCLAHISNNDQLTAVDR